MPPSPVRGAFHLEERQCFALRSKMSKMSLEVLAPEAMSSGPRRSAPPSQRSPVVDEPTKSPSVNKRMHRHVVPAPR